MQQMVPVQIVERITRMGPSAVYGICLLLAVLVVQAGAFLSSADDPALLAKRGDLPESAGLASGNSPLLVAQRLAEAVPDRARRTTEVRGRFQPGGFSIASAPSDALAVVASDYSDLRLGDRSDGWRHLREEVRSAIDARALMPSDWSALVAHGGGAGLDGQEEIAHYHRSVLQLAEGPAYHFVIGNGSASGDGTIEIGPRWSAQKAGPVGAEGDILVALVGDFERQGPSAAQLEALDELLAYLRGKLGEIPFSCHRGGAGAGCLGATFPADLLERSLN